MNEVCSKILTETKQAVPIGVHVSQDLLDVRGELVCVIEQAEQAVALGRIQSPALVIVCKREPKQRT